ncbi:YIPF1-like protein [Trifolium medium]|uniref:YIPF1-like protein n=1 Tax=Trifolium medium TaxID=97028 RepID=A0A392MFM0_9FABA|nr:YIPF1-like protein [Trifolium medium]
MVWDGEQTLFWNDSWMDEIQLKTQFARLFQLCLDKDITVADMHRLGWDVGDNGWQWRKALFAWEEELWRECCAVLTNVEL